MEGSEGKGREGTGRERGRRKGRVGRRREGKENEGREDEREGRAIATGLYIDASLYKTHLAESREKFHYLACLTPKLLDRSSQQIFYMM